MTYINITKFVLNQLEKDHSMIETLFKKCCNFYPKNLSFVLSRKVISKWLFHFTSNFTFCISFRNLELLEVHVIHRAKIIQGKVYSAFKQV